MLTISKEFTLHAAHRLFRPDLTEAENSQIYGKCTELHGHTYRMRVTLCGQPDENGLILHFGELERIVEREILARYDHANLNTLEEYRNRPPTAEHMALHIFEVLDRALSCRRFQLEKVTVFETPTAWATQSRHA